MSHPTRVRGLKQYQSQSVELKRYVAPYTGAWIETPVILDKSRSIVSHPTRVRGLKLMSPLCIKVLTQSHPTRVRGLKRLLTCLL